MKKQIKKFIATAIVFSAIIGLSNVAEAAMHPWKKVPQAGSTCEVRAWTDYLSYSTRATSVDFYLEQRGNCGTLRYSATANIYDGGGYLNAISSVETGSFSYRTPVKKAKLTKFSRPSSGPLFAQLYKNGKSVGSYQSNNLSFPR